MNYNNYNYYQTDDYYEAGTFYNNEGNFDNSGYYDDFDDEECFGKSNKWKKNNQNNINNKKDASTSEQPDKNNKRKGIDSQNRRIITKDQLYADPDLYFYEDGAFQQGFDWTQQNWLKSGRLSPVFKRKKNRKSANGPPVKVSKVHRKLLKDLSQPVKMSKAESMMAKMGWQGGALGKTGDGIVEPIAPNIFYTKTSFGLGHINEPKQPHPSKKMSKRERKFDKDFYKKNGYFKTNVLYQLLSFVKNDKEIEVVFDSSLWPVERKWIHIFVEKMMNEDNDDLDLDTVDQMDIVQEIISHNTYLLCTESEGKAPKRQLCLYKEAQEHIYLITPDDLKEEEEISEQAPDAKQAEIKESKPKNNNKRNKKSNITVDNNKKLLTSDVIQKETVSTTKVIEKEHASVLEHTKSVDSITEQKDDEIIIEQKGDETIIEQKNDESENVINVNSKTNSVVVQDSDKHTENIDINPIPDNINEDFNIANTNTADSDQTNAANEKNTEVVEIDIHDVKNADIVMTDIKRTENDKQLEVDKNNHEIECKESNAALEKDTDPVLIDLSNDGENKEAKKEIDSFKTIVDYFKEFAEEEEYTELRFLGRFEGKDLEAVDKFLDEVVKCVYGDVTGEEDTELAEVFKNTVKFSISSDRNGSTVIYKVKEDSPL